MKKQVKLWLDFADIDLKTAQKISDERFLTQAAAFHCQQCIEKILKAYIESSDQKVPRVHNLQYLFELASSTYKIECQMDILDQINEVYIDTRYPGDAGLIPCGQPSLELINKFIAFCERFYTQALKALNI
jgi:HEPN domain-containing protein